MTNSKQTLLVLDANAILHRAFYALPPLTTKEGKPINAVYGFLLVLFKVIKEFRPDFLAVAFDFPAPTFREKIFKEYKAKRPKAPDEFYQQIPEIKKILQEIGVKIFEKKGYEADDIIGTISKIVKEQEKDSEIETIIVTGDLDMLQLVDSLTKVYLLKRGIKNTGLYDENLVKEKLELLPGQISDFKALFGDPSDNIPGVYGIGRKTACQLIKNFQSLEGLYKVMAQTYVEFANVQVALSQLIASIEANQKEAEARSELLSGIIEGIANEDIGTIFGSFMTYTSNSDEIDSDRFIDFLQGLKELLAGIEKGKITLLEGKIEAAKLEAEIKTLLLRMTTLAIESMEAAVMMDQEMAKLRALLDEAAYLEAKWNEAEKNLASRYFADPSHRIIMNDKIIEARHAFDRAQLWVYIMARALDYKWNTHVQADWDDYTYTAKSAFAMSEDNSFVKL